MPEAVQTNDHGDKFVNYSAITPLLIEGIKEQQVLIEDMQTVIDDLQKQINGLKEKE